MSLGWWASFSRASRAAFLVAAIDVLPLVAGTAVPGSRMAAPCCLTNPRFAGVCRVVPHGDETCGGVLAYLNDPNSVGKDYCDNTTVRGGWKQVECGGAASRPHAGAAAVTSAVTGPPSRNDG